MRHFIEERLGCKLVVPGTDAAPRINGGNWPARIRSALPQSPDINDARRQFLVRSDIVAKLGEGHSARNNRIKTGEFLIGAPESTWNNHK
jgi:hypothetical protein